MLALSTCLSDIPILGSGHVLLYPLDTVQHTLVEHLDLLRVLVRAESCLLVFTMGELFYGACYHGVCLYNQQGFLGLDAIVFP